MDKDKLKWVIDNLRILTNGKDVLVPLYNSTNPIPHTPKRCSSEGVDAYDSGSCRPACDRLKLYVQKKDSTNHLKVGHIILL